MSGQDKRAELASEVKRLAMRLAEECDEFGCGSKQEAHCTISLHAAVDALAAPSVPSEIEKAAERLVRCKGRYHTEQNMIALAALFGVKLPPAEAAPSVPAGEAPAHTYWGEAEAMERGRTPQPATASPEPQPSIERIGWVHEYVAMTGTLGGPQDVTYRDLFAVEHEARAELSKVGKGDIYAAFRMTATGCTDA